MSDDEFDPGEPIRVLADLQEPFTPRVKARVRNAIRRRHLAGDLLDFTLLTPGMVFVTYITGLFGALSRSPDDPGAPGPPDPHPTSRTES